MSAVKVIGYIAAAIFIFFGILFIWGAFSPTGSTGWIPVGVISVLAGFGLIWFVGRQKPASFQPGCDLENRPASQCQPGFFQMQILRGGTDHR